VTVAVEREEVESTPSVLPVAVLLSDDLQVVPQNVDLREKQCLQVLALADSHRGELDRRALAERSVA
jgi:hypothetical protein